MTSSANELLVCFSDPGAIPERATILSFAGPAVEERLRQEYGPRFVTARDVVDDVRETARQMYVEFLARLGASPFGGSTLRSSLRDGASVSPWWFLKVTEKDETLDDGIYPLILFGLCIERVAAEHGSGATRFVGAPPFLVRALQPRGESWGSLSLTVQLFLALARGVAARGRLIADCARRRLEGRRSTGVGAADVLLQGHLRMSLRIADGVTDLYFRDLPAMLRQHGVRSAWLAVADTTPIPRDVPANVIVLEGLLDLKSIVKAAFSFGPLFRFMRFLRSPDAAGAFRVGRWNLRELVAPQVIAQLAGSAVPRATLVAVATERACERSGARLLMTFLELFLHARALNAGASRAGVEVWACQHAAYSADKTIGTLDPAVEFDGRPDDCAVPSPARMLAMGELSRRVWERAGFRPSQITVTGGLRYQHVRVQEPRLPGPHALRVLLVPSMIDAFDLEMCEAVVAAARGLDGVQLTLRNHPVHRTSDHPRFAAFRNEVRISRGTLEEDIAQTDLVIFTYSTVAEEALLAGIPVWQWVRAERNPSVFLEISGAPRFKSISQLRAALMQLVREPGAFTPPPAVQREVLAACFGPEPSKASARISEQVALFLGRARPVAATVGRNA